ncbi:PAS domain S-box protein [Corallococcus interemptor]|uniref:histidine kinase n=2 Tax=Corallococcus interemptor TaxID=2316720 RepID=A0A3A8QX17_9BACT|nr:PAS domain S-box protein [Corallococcus interemptor]
MDRLHDSPTPQPQRAPPPGHSLLLDAVLASMGEGLLVADEFQHLVFINPKAESILGMGATDEPVSRWPAHYGLHLPDQVTLYPSDQLPMSRALKGESISRAAVFLRNAERPAGTWLHVSSSPVRDEIGRVRGGVSVVSDVTDLKRAEDAAREGATKYRSLYNSTPVMMHSIDTHGRLISVSDYWLDTMGYERGEVLGRESVEFLTPESQRYAREVVLPEYFKTGWSRDVPYQVVKKNGQVMDVLLSAIVERDDAGQMVRSLAVLTDVTERKRMEASQRFLAEASRELVASLDPETTLQRVAKLAVPLMADLCVFFLRTDSVVLRPVAVADRSPARGASVREFLRLHPPRPEAPHGPSRVLATGRPEASDASQGLLDAEALAEVRWAEVRSLQGRPSLGVPLQARGRTLGVLYLLSSEPGRAFAPDELALMEELGRRAAFSIDNAQLYCSAQESIRARDEFLSIASHELKTPLTSMRLRLQQLESNLMGSRPLSKERMSKMLEVFKEQLQRLAHLADHLLDVSRINEKRLDLRLEDMDLVAVASHVAGHVAEQFHKAGCEFELVSREPVWGHWDRLRMEQVMLNLLTNAMKYGAGSPIRMEVTSHDGMARLIVTDHGMGIPIESQARIFERFERASSRNYGGLGLGLFITRRIIEAHGGSIRVESEPGHGAKFIVELPPRPSH